MKNRKFIYIIVLILILGGGLYFVGYQKQNPSQPFQKEGVNTEKEVQIAPKALSVNNNPSPTPPLVRAWANTKTVQATLNVLDKTYKIKVEDSTNLYDAMKSLQDTKENNFSFSGKEYSSLGIFIDEINGVKDGSGKYWLYYVNNTEASVGVSNYILKDGDSILWKQE